MKRVPVYGYEGLYEINDQGSVFSVCKPGGHCCELRKASKSSYTLSKNDTQKCINIGTLLISSFYNVDINVYDIHLTFRDGDKSNFSLDNLSYTVSPKMPVSNPVDLPEEVWRDIKNHPYYQVSNFGNFRSLPREIIDSMGRR